MVNIFAYTPKVFVYLGIRYSDNCQTIFFKKKGSFLVVLLGFLGIMSRAVKLNHKLRFSTVKVRYIFSKDFLTAKANGISTKKIIPKMFFFFGHILSQHSCSRNESGVVFSFHCNPSVIFFGKCHLPLHKGGLFLRHGRAVPPPLHKGGLVVILHL